MSMENKPQFVYKSRDLGESAALLCIGFDFITTEQDQNGRVYFCFPDSLDLRIAVKAHWDCTLDVKSRYYFDATRTLKNVIYKDKP